MAQETGVVNGSPQQITALNRQQRDLISIFVEYLRSLTEWSDAENHQTERQIAVEYYFVLRLLIWKLCPGQQFEKAVIPEEHRERFCELLKGAASADQVARWRRKLKATEARMERLRQELTLATASHEDLLRVLDGSKVSKKQLDRKLVSL